MQFLFFPKVISQGAHTEYYGVYKDLYWIRYLLSRNPHLSSLYTGS